ncbi:glutathione S-transferase T3-like [Brassica napus]|uniref:glutathione S-transferase T3-like n=1 Tax=Brassica napus TaxID=3708 RepID=UPI0006AB49B1|nr:glutathione S-transferase T3-like [Brassica napus]
MDPRNPMNPYSDSSSYLRLLHSQQPSVVHENFPYESFHATSVNLGASEVPPFSSQQTEPPSQPVVTPVERRERKKWTPADDEVLISAWLNTSKDAVVANDQNARTFWKRVGEYYAASHHARNGDDRPHLHCKQRWHKINEQVNKFCASYASAERQQASGQSETDVLKLAHDIFYADHETKFTLEHAWCVLRFEQKWLNLNTPKPTGSSKRKTGDGEPEASGSEAGDHDKRPEGVKAAKARRNNSKGKGVDDAKTIWEFKKEDLLMKERLSRLAILDTLLARKEPLSEAEEVVKNKLLAQYF